jgi:hypothetical protein
MPLAGAYRPGKHVPQNDMPIPALTVPLGHSRHDVDPVVPEYVPDPQGIQTAFPVHGANDPLEQGEQDEAPATDELVPAGHDRQYNESPVGEYVPAGQ